MPQTAAKLTNLSNTSLDSTSEGALNPVEIEIIDLFVNGVKMLGFPRSVGEIYGLLFITREPLPLDALVDRLQISKGSASQGLRLLRSLNAVRLVYVGGDRRDHFLAETQLKKLAAGFIKEELEPHLSSGEERLSHLNESLAKFGSESGEDERGEFYREQVEQLERWHTQSRKLLPVIAKLLG